MTDNRRRRPRLSFAAPIYAQIRDHLQMEIESGRLAPDQPLPSERALCAQFQVSRGTARQALRDLEHDALIYHRDRVGYFVQPSRVIYQLHETLSVTDELASQGLYADALVVERAVEVPSRRVREALRLEIGTLVLRIKRVRLANQQPILIETLFLSAERFPMLVERDLNRLSLWQVLRDTYSVRFGHTELLMRLVTLAQDEARLLGGIEGAAAFAVLRLIHSADGEPIELSHEVYRADTAEFRSVALPQAGVSLPAPTLDIRLIDVD